MKQKIIAAVIFAALLTLVSCDKYEDGIPENQCVSIFQKLEKGDIILEEMIGTAQERCNVYILRNEYEPRAFEHDFYEKRLVGQNYECNQWCCNKILLLLFHFIPFFSFLTLFSSPKYNNF